MPLQTLWSPLMKGEIVAPGVYHDILPQVHECVSAFSQPGYVLLKHIKKI